LIFLGKIKIQAFPKKIEALNQSKIFSGKETQVINQIIGPNKFLNFRKAIGILDKKDRKN
jgi:hypothetical protein